MRNFQDLCSLPIYFDEKKGAISFGEEIVCDNFSKVQLRSLIPALLNKSLVYPELVYDEIKNVRPIDCSTFGKDLMYDVFFLPEGLLGVEYIKSHVYYSPNGDSKGKISTVIEVIFGELTILMQKNKNLDEWGYEKAIEEIRVITAKEGEKVIIDKGFFYTFINTSEQPVIFSRVYRQHGLINYTEFKREQGLAYFCIRKNARREFVQNPRYRNIPKINFIKNSDHHIDFELDLSIPLYSQVTSRTQEFVDSLWF